MDLDRDFSEFISFCIARSVRFLVVGGYALAAHGRPRFTKDLDIWIWADTANAERLVAALDDFGFSSTVLAPEDFVEPGTVIQLGYAPKRIGILTTIDGVEFSGSWTRRAEVEIDGLVVPFIGLDDLIANKRASGRLRDLADVDGMSEVDDDL